MADLARVLIIVGLTLAFVGVALAIGHRFGLGRLPGDVDLTIGPIRIWAPLTTSILVSVVLTVIVNLILRR